MSSPADEAPDPRELSLVEAHSVIARETLRSLTAKTLEIAQEFPEKVSDPVKESLAATEQSKYTVRVLMGGFFTVDLDIWFLDTDYIFSGVAGGIALGGQATWGTAWFNYPIEKIIGWDARFQVTYWTATTVINFWGMRGEIIGSIVAGGLGIGGGLAGGQGTFKR
ncbi:VapA/VapB family virulence-associated protein [Nonomuraea sediminis]|uniref:VapA/VapB family virulence-associated protein n=1 Tax=Nonomuraea sediminis TaxID=2835864 RepID=UPI001BDC5AD3|nr:VapA/VapB family virulence-associated protein [Nonomuraea sediminis]